MFTCDGFSWTNAIIWFVTCWKKNPFCKIHSSGLILPINILYLETISTWKSSALIVHTLIMEPKLKAYPPSQGKKKWIKRTCHGTCHSTTINWVQVDWTFSLWASVDSYEHITCLNYKLSTNIQTLRLCILRERDQLTAQLDRCELLFHTSPHPLRRRHDMSKRKILKFLWKTHIGVCL